jgi:uncharacterized protein (TIGR02217 family)
MSTPGFLELQLDPLVSYGTSGGPGFSTLVVSNNSRNEQRVQQQSRGYWKLALSFSDKSKTQLTTIQNHFAVVMGKTYGWRFRNWRDYQATNEPIAALSTPTTMQLTKTITMGGISTVTLIRKPDMVLPITLTRDGAAFPSSGNWTLDTTTGIVTFTASQTGHVFTWTGQYDMAARFDVDDMGGSWDDFNVFSWPSINIMEIQV